jgi:hypothetical protein
MSSYHILHIRQITSCLQVLPELVKSRPNRVGGRGMTIEIRVGASRSGWQSEQWRARKLALGASFATTYFSSLRLSGELLFAANPRLAAR